MKQSLGAKTWSVPSPVWVVGTNDKEGKPNFMTAAWGGICCSRPPCIYVSLREATYSYGNIVERQAYTVSIPGEEYWRETDYMGIASGRDTDKMKDTDLTAIQSELVDAPYVDEFPLILECKVIETVKIGLHTQFIGEILDVKADEDVITGGAPDTQKIRPLLFGSGDRGYHTVGVKLADAFTQRKPPTI
ncbi:MAG: flavin reductase family protein [Candidatus Bathyarchaeota archaeon]|nr:flavin reductase family protein [Candidatus Bathyarchaeota archaeon]